MVATGQKTHTDLALGPDVLTPVYSYLSQTESSEYTTTREQYAADDPGQRRRQDHPDHCFGARGTEPQGTVAHRRGNRVNSIVG